MGNGGKWNAKSKRQSTKMRVKIEKKVKDHAKKLKKEKKKNPGKFKKSKKDPGVPNNCPFKDKVLAEAQEATEKRNQEKEKRRLQMKEMRKNGKSKKLSELRGQSLESLVSSAQQKEAAFKNRSEVEKSALNLGCSDRSAKAYYREFRKVVDAADVILQILDARDPLGSRCKEVEESVINFGGKRLVLVLNKADLVPRENLLAWVKYLRKEFPTIAFKASTQSGGRLGQAKVDLKNSEAVLTTSKCVGADTLLSLLGNYCRNKDIKTNIRVGVVGLPNVGKSSLINSLKRSRACNVGATPGVTKAMQEVQLDSKIKLLDCPGMVLASGEMSDASVALRNALKVESLADPVTPVVAILARVPREHLMLQYSLSTFADTSEFLAKLAMSLGKLKKGGVPDREIAARIVLGDWNSGKIKYCTHPPEASKEENNSEIVANFASEFSIEELKHNEIRDMDTLPSVRPSDIVEVESGKILSAAESIEDDEEEDMETENDENALPANVQVFAKSNKREQRKEIEDEEARIDKAREKRDPLFKIEGNQRLEKLAKLSAKKRKKDAKRRDKVAEGLSDQMEGAFSDLIAK